MRMTGGADKLDLECLGCMDMHDSSKISGTEAVLGEILQQDDDIELTVSHGRANGFAVSMRAWADALHIDRRPPPYP